MRKLAHFSLLLAALSVRVDQIQAAVPLGMEDGTITADQISASSCYQFPDCADHARLNHPAEGGRRGAWCAADDDPSPWIQVDLLTNFLITGVITQGRYPHYSQWVTSYQVLYRPDGEAEFQMVTDASGQNVTFKGNTDKNTPVENDLPIYVVARYVRLLPVTFNEHVSMRFELLGENVTECYEQADASDYRGSVSETEEGITCQVWTVQKPHSHNRKPSHYPDAGLGAHNLCRNPDGENTAWCYTIDPDVRWALCSVGEPSETCPVVTTTRPEGTTTGMKPEDNPATTPKRTTTGMEPEDDPTITIPSGTSEYHCYYQ
ncbi:inactive carboxypeptidase-like protein X2 [Diadema setosum]|uniref:inactive carboxypeptidase-like protein X2 n=1 Tax=Diadema setosum TaxID=31175 RepID=UPI003B3B8BDD